MTAGFLVPRSLAIQEATHENAAELIEYLKEHYGIRGLNWRRVDLAARVEELLECGRIDLDGSTVEQVVDIAVTTEEWNSDSWVDSSVDQWDQMAGAVHAALEMMGIKTGDY